MAYLDSSDDIVSLLCGVASLGSQSWHGGRQWAPWVGDGTPEAVSSTGPSSSWKSWSRRYQ